MSTGVQNRFQRAHARSAVSCDYPTIVLQALGRTDQGNPGCCATQMLQWLRLMILMLSVKPYAITQDLRMDLQQLIQLQDAWYEAGHQDFTALAC